MTRKVKVQFVNLTKVYQNTKSEIVALRDLSLSVYENEFVSIMGPSGCGKTTLLHILAGFIQPTIGEALIDGSPVAKPSRDKAIVFQENGIFPWFDVQKNIEYGLKLSNFSRPQREAIATELLSLIELNHFANTFPKYLSEGMKKRVEIARALANSPDLLLLDEPFASLDAMTRMRMHETVQKLWLRAPHTTIFTSHDFDESIFLSDRIVILSARPGTIKAIIDVNFERPRTLLVRNDDDFRRLRHQLVDLLEAREII